MSISLGAGLDSLNVGSDSSNLNSRTCPLLRPLPSFIDAPTANIT